VGNEGGSHAPPGVNTSGRLIYSWAHFAMFLVNGGRADSCSLANPIVFRLCGDADMTPRSSIKTNAIRTTLIAPCGMNCHLCRAYRRDKNVKACPGCRRDDEHKPTTCVTCRIKNCEKIVKGGLKYCFICASFPCARLKHLDKRYRTKYGMSMIGNLEDIGKLGLRQFVRAEKARWTCPKCGDMICVHKPRCLSCGRKWR
jgi:hypothetical protein